MTVRISFLVLVNTGSTKDMGKGMILAIGSQRSLLLRYDMHGTAFCMLYDELL